MKKEVRRKFHKSAEIEVLFLHVPLLCYYGAAQIRLRMRNYGSIRSRGSRQSSTETDGQAVKIDFRSRSKGQGQFLTVKHLDRGRERTYDKCLSDHPLHKYCRACSFSGTFSLCLLLCSRALHTMMVAFGPNRSGPLYW